MRNARRLIRGEKGGVLALITISMTVLLSFGAGVSDIGLMYETRRQLQNGTDGAALAGATELALQSGEAAAINSALDYAQRNGVPPSRIDSGYPEVTDEGPYTNNAVKVAATRRLNLLVAGILGNGVSQVQARSTAVIGPVLPTEGLWPWGVPQSEALVGQRVGLKVGSPPPNPGNFRPMDFPPLGGGSRGYEEGIMYGYGQSDGDFISPTLPWDVPTQTGNMVGPTRAGVDYLIDLATTSGQDDLSSPWNQPKNTCTWPGAPKSASDPDAPPPAGWVGDASACYRIGVVPLLISYDVNGKKEVTIVNWGAFYLIGYENGPGGSMNVWGYFLDLAMVSGGRSNWGAPMSGLIGVRLWR